MRISPLLAIAALVAAPFPLVAVADGIETIQAETALRTSLPVPLIPLPEKVVVNDGVTDLGGAKIIGPATKHALSDRGISHLKNAFAKGSSKATIRLVLDDKASDNPEGYTLDVNADGAVIRAPKPVGLLYGATTLAQIKALGNSTAINRMNIVDAPKLPYRSVMHDIGRSYMSIPRLKRHLDLMALYKINVFHWHLTENHAWRFEVKKHPELTRAEFHEPDRAPGKFYSQAEIKEIIAYAKARGITVVPEIDLPGHSAALRRALGVKRMDDPKVAPVLYQAFRELIALAPKEDMPYIHAGSDEAYGADEQLPQEVLNNIYKIIHDSGRTLFMWTPGKKVPPGDNTIQMLWQVAKPNNVNKFIDARSIYINLNTGADAVRTTYWNVPATDGKPDRRFGGTLAMWLDLPTLDENIERVTPFWPAFITFADRAWHGGVFRQDLLVTLPPEDSAEAKAYSAFNKAVLAHRDTFFKGLPFPYVDDDQGYWRLLGPIPNQGKKDTAFAPEKNPGEAVTVTVGDKTYEWDKIARGYQVFIRHMFGWSGAIDKTPPLTTPWAGNGHRDDVRNSTVYARAILESDADREVGFWIQIDPPNASDRRDGPNPKIGQWNHDQAKVWINGKEIEPPKWATPGQGAAGGPNMFRVALTDEYSHLRPAIRVKLKKGENTVLLRLPEGGKKWEFICHPVEWDGTNAREVKGVTFKKW